MGLLKRKMCPCCGQAHGYSNWRAFNSSRFRPLRCGNCKDFFHHRQPGVWAYALLLFAPYFWVGVLVMLAVSVLLPGSVLRVLSWLPQGIVGPYAGGLLFGLGFILVNLIAVLYVDRRYTLVPGPTHG